MNLRDMPKGWPAGYIRITTRGPGEKPKCEYHPEVAQLDEALLQSALALTHGATLADNDKPRAYRAGRVKPATQNLRNVGGLPVKDMVANRARWRNGVPP